MLWFEALGDVEVSHSPENQFPDEVGVKRSFWDEAESSNAWLKIALFSAASFGELLYFPREAQSHRQNERNISFDVFASKTGLIH